MDVLSGHYHALVGGTSPLPPTGPSNSYSSSALDENIDVNVDIDEARLAHLPDSVRHEVLDLHKELITAKSKEWIREKKAMLQRIEQVNHTGKFFVLSY